MLNFVVGLCETFLFDGINDCEIHIPDFIVIRSDRFSGRCCMYIFEKQSVTY